MPLAACGSLWGRGLCGREQRLRWRRQAEQMPLELLAAGRAAPVVPHLPVLGRQVLPLLQLMNQELGLALPVAEIERRLNERNARKK